MLLKVYNGVLPLLHMINNLEAGDEKELSGEVDVALKVCSFEFEV